MSHRTVRTLLEAAVLVVVWVALWADLTVANVLSGIVVATGVLALFRWTAAARDARLVVRPLRALRFVTWFLWQLLKSNVAVARLVLSRRPALDPGFVAYRLHTESPGVATLVANAVTLTPGTLTVTLSRDPLVLYVHCLRVVDVSSVRASLLELELHALRAFAPRDEVDAAAAPPSVTPDPTDTGS